MLAADRERLERVLVNLISKGSQAGDVAGAGLAPTGEGLLQRPSLRGASGQDGHDC